MGKPKFGTKQYASAFKKENEKASAGYYTVFLEKPKVKVELTATTRSGLHKYTFPKSTSANIILDLTHRDRVKQGEINFVAIPKLPVNEIVQHGRIIKCSCM